MDNWIDKIAEATPEEVEEALQAVLDRYQILYPDWSVCTMSIDKKGSRIEQLDTMIRMLESLKASEDTAE